MRRRRISGLAALVAAGTLSGPGTLIGSGTGARPPGEARFEPRSAAAPYFAEGRGKEAMALLARHEHAGCARELAALLASGPKQHVVQARFLLSYCQLKSGLYPAAAAGFDALAPRYPLLADHARLFAAEAYLGAGRNDEAAARAAEVTSASALRAEAELTRSTALDRGGHPREAADGYARYLASYPSSWRAGEVRGRLAVALDAAARPAEAAKVWREIYIENPISLGAKAEPRLDPTQPLSAEELARRAAVLFDAMKNKDSELAWQAVLGVKPLSPQLACRARYHVAQSVWKQRDRQRAAPLFEEAATSCATAKDDDLTAKSLYQAGRSHGSRTEKDAAAGERAVLLYARLMSEHAAHSYADDAALRRADVLDMLGRGDEASVALAQLPEHFPAGDQRGEALFRLAFRAFEKGDAKAAQGWLERELALLPREEGWFEAGRTLYWLARTHALLGDATGALGFYTRAVREYPLSYYALMAVNRLRDSAPAEAERLLAELSGTSDQSATAERTGKLEPAAPGLSVADAPVFHSPAFLRGLELLKLGLGGEARRELTAAGVEPARRGGSASTDPELGWVAAELYEAAGDYSTSHAYGRYLDLSFQRTWPLGSGERRWRLTFPRAYGELVTQAVKQTTQPAALELAIMREESAFDPNLESFANAVGLTQLTAAPAARFAEGLPHDAQALRDPAINIAIGARELGSLYALFDKNAALAIAGYNAGEGAVKRWLRDPDNKDRALDEFIERIPYDETRGYTKRVLGTYFTYAWLDRDAGPPSARSPKIDFALPRAKKR